MAIGEKAVMANAVEAIRQGVEQEAADELVNTEGHDLRLAVVAIVLPAEGDLGVGHGDQARVGDGDAVRISTKIGQHLCGTAEGRLGIDHPFDLTHLPQLMTERSRLGKVGEIAKEPEIAGLERRAQFVEERPSEEPREDANRQEEAGSAADPARAIRRWAAARYDAMDVWMMVQVLAPGMEHGDDADFGAEMPGIAGNLAQRLGRGSEQDGVDRLLVLERDLGHRRRQRKHDMEVRHRQQLGLASLQPFGAGLALALRAMPVAAGIIGAADQPTIRADLAVAAERRRPTEPDSTHHAPLDTAEMTIMRMAIDVTMVAEDIRHFQTGRHGRARSGGRHDLQREPVERAFGLPD